jgi:ABC-2 type transport system ATP-binding protein
MIVEACDEGTTIFFSSHNMSEVQDIAKRVAIIRNGVVVEVADTQALIKRTLRRVDIRFSQEVNIDSLQNLPGVKMLSSTNDRNIRLQIEGEMDKLIKTLATYPVSDFETEQPTLEEVFMAYYEKERSGTGTE